MIAGTTIEYSINDTIETNAAFDIPPAEGSTLRFIIAKGITAEPTISKTFAMNADGAFTIKLTQSERNKLAIGNYIYKMIVIGIDGSIKTRISGDFIVTWHAARENVINISAGKGDKGEPGYTPQKGVDYFTPEEIALFEKVENKTSAIDDNSTNDQYPSAYATFVFGQNIRKQAVTEVNNGLIPYQNWVSAELQQKANRTQIADITGVTSFDIPLIGDFIEIPIYGETRLVYEKGEVES